MASTEASILFEGSVTMFLAGPTSCGKTFFARRLIENRRGMFVDYPETVYYCFVLWQPAVFGEMQKNGVKFHQGLPTLETIKKWSVESGGKHMLLVLDDLQAEISQSKEIASVFSIHSHHLHISTIYISQNVLPQGRCSCDITLNCHYIILFNSKRDKLQISNLARQIFPRQNNYLMDAYDQAVVTRDRSYLLIDLHPTSKKEYMVRTDIFPGELPIIFHPK
jgi:hypothetical protein